MLAENQITLEIVSDGGQGPQGPQGPTGNDGKSAYEAAVEAGYSGTEATFNTDLADTSVTKATANNALETAESILIYDHDYEIVNGVAYFEARVYKGGVDVHTQYDAEMFTWWYKDENQVALIPIVTDTTHGTNYGYTCQVTLSEVGYGRHIVGHFTTADDAFLLTTNNAQLTTSNSEPLTVRTASGESVRVSDLTVVTTLYSTDKLMVVGAEGEHLVTVRTLQDYLNANLTKQVLFNTTAGWNAQTTLVSDANTLYIYTDHQTDSSGNNVAGIKAGDGSAYVVDLPFTDAVATEHVANSTIHVTPSDKTRWNSAVQCYYAGTENLIFANV